jgi:glucose-6-phosphate isomerase
MGVAAMSARELWQDIELRAAMARRHGLGAAAAAPAEVAALQWSRDGILVDLSRTGLSADTLDLLLDHAGALGLDAARARLLDGDGPHAADRARLPPPALRRPPGRPARIGGEDISVDLAAWRHWPESLAEAVRDGQLGAASGAPLADVVHLGRAEEAGSAALAAAALAPRNGRPQVHFTTETDGAELLGLLDRLDPGRTLVVLGAETMAAPLYRAAAGRLCQWLALALGSRAACHLAAVSAEPDTARVLGVPAERIILAPPRIVDGLSVWSPVHLGLMLALSPEVRAGLAAGAAGMDEHFRTAPLRACLPVLLGLADLWTERALRAAPPAVVACDPALRIWPRFAAGLRGAGLRSGTPPGLAAHELVVSAEPQCGDWSGYLAAATAEALARLSRRNAGEDRAALVSRLRALGLAPDEADERARRRSAATQEPAILIGHARLDAAMLGRLIALHEHRAFVLSALRPAEAELPEAARRTRDRDAQLVAGALAGEPALGLDLATRAAIRQLLALRAGAPGEVARGPVGAPDAQGPADLLDLPQPAAARGARRDGGAA